MKMKLLLKTAICLLLVATACDKTIIHPSPSQRAASAKYNADYARQHGDVVDLHGQMSNIEKLDDFVANVQLGVKSAIRITRYTIEGDPIFYDLAFDENKIQYKFDNSMDTFGAAQKRKLTCRSFTTKDAGERIHYTLSGCEGTAEDEVILSRKR